MSWLKSKPSNRIFILPTPFGLSYAAGTTLILLIGAGYQNNLVNLLGFFMLAMLFTSMFITNSNIKSLEISRIEEIRGFASEELPITVVVRNTSRKPRSNIEFEVKGLKKIAQYDARNTIYPLSDAKLQASFTAPSRGVHKFGQITLLTTAPFNLFRAWCPIRSHEIQATIYPRRIGKRPWQELALQHEEGFHKISGSQDFLEHRPYQAGDSLRRVDWKVLSRGKGVLTKHFDEPSQAGLLFSFYQLTDLDFETRLEQISKWTDTALKNGLPFSVLLPGKKLGPDQGLNYSHRVWMELSSLKDPMIVEKPQPRQAG